MPLDQLLQSGSFRSDLYYRLCVFSIHLPPLRDRRDDILALASHFLQKHAAAGKTPLKFAPGACAALLSCDWPGNVRQLESAIIRGIHLTRTDSIDAENLGLQSNVKKLTAAAAVSPTELRSFKATKREIVETFEKDYLIRLMSEHGGNVSQAARSAGKERRDLGKLLKKYRLDPKLFVPPVGGSHR
jgi:DNA-binding NtrC family response regulator